LKLKLKETAMVSMKFLVQDGYNSRPVIQCVFWRNRLLEGVEGDNRCEACHADNSFILVAGRWSLKWLIVIIVVLSGFLTPTSYAGEPSRVYTIGVVPQFESRVIYAVWQPILDRLQEKTGYKFMLRGSSSITDFEREFISGRFDFAYMNPFHLVIANENAGYLPLVRDHANKLYGVLVVNSESDITDPAQLEDKILAFPSPNALGASLLIRQELHDEFGIRFESIFVKTHDSVYLNVLLNEVSAGGGVQRTLDQQKDQYKKMLRVIHKTKEVEPHPFVVLPDVPVEVQNRVRDALLEMGQLKEGKALLSKIPIGKIGPASMDDYLPLKLMRLERFYSDPKICRIDKCE